jgi:hypothetical protein
VPGDQHPDLLETFDVIPGTCGVSRSVSLLKTALEIDRIDRSPVGFVASGHKGVSGEPGWLSLSLDGLSQRALFSDWTAAGATMLARFSFTESLQQLHPMLLTAPGPGSETRLNAWPLDDPGTELDVGEHFLRGTTSMAIATSRDGKRAVFVAQHPVTFAPHVLPLDRHGAEASGQFALDDGTVTCLMAAPSEDSFAVGVLYSAPTPLLKVVAPGYDSGSASVALSPSAPSCPLLQFDEQLLVAAAVDGAVQVFAFSSGALMPMLSHPPRLADLGGQTPFWITRGTDGGWVFLLHQEGKSRLASVSSDGAVVSWIAGDLPWGDVIAGAPRELFMNVDDPDQTGTYRRRIVQVTCNGTGFSRSD